MFLFFLRSPRRVWITNCDRSGGKSAVPETGLTFMPDEKAKTFVNSIESLTVNGFLASSATCATPGELMLMHSKRTVVVTYETRLPLSGIGRRRLVTGVDLELFHESLGQIGVDERLMHCMLWRGRPHIVAAFPGFVE